MSVRINACSNSSQSIGLPANCCASASRNFTELDRIYKIYRIEKRRVVDLALIQTILLILSFFLGRGDSFPRGASQIFSDAIENAPEVILDGRFARASPFTHITYLFRNFEITFEISTAARAASVPRFISFSRQRSRA